MGNGIRDRLKIHLSKLTACCTRLKTRQSISADHRRRSENQDKTNKLAATLSDVDRFLFENFRSLYYDGSESDGDKEDDGCSNGSPEYHQHYTDELLLLNIQTSPRFFTTLNTSNSLMADGRMHTGRFLAVVGGGINGQSS